MSFMFLHSWEFAMRCAVERAKETGVRQRVYKSRWTTLWLVQDVMEPRR